MSDDPTPLCLPPHLPYPITITRLLFSSAAAFSAALPESNQIARGTKLLEYSFTSDTSRRALAKRTAGTGDARKRGEGEEEGIGENDMVGSWECPIEGEFVKWGKGVEVGMKVEKRQANRPVVYVQQACTHPVQLHGLCGICGKELTENDYITPASATASAPGPSRFPGAYEMGHDSLGVTVSSNEAARLESQSRTDLLSSRRLSLIVDLDQTIIHTTVDPTVGEWLEEIRRSDAEEAAAAAAAQAAPAEGGEAGSSEKPQSKPAKVKRRPNPNAEALRDVASFQLEDDMPPGAAPGRRSGAERWYYTKPRPGLPKFLESMSELYEMHVYTMGTRTYADAICKAVDPDGKIFGGRILSRDESGSLSSKSLKRLFPTDQSMVVVIDDRADVWGELPNLVKVIPYDFFLGIGDINSNPAGNKTVRTSGTVGGSSPSRKSPSPSSPSASSGSPASASSSSAAGPTTPEAQSVDTADAQAGITAGDDIKEDRLHKVEEERPLKKLAEQMEKALAASLEAAAGPDRDTAGGLGGGTSEGKPGAASEAKEGTIAQRSTTPEGSPPPADVPLLNPKDYELGRLSRILTEIHRSFYAAYDARPPDAADEDPPPMGCDVELTYQLIIPDMKSRVLEGCSIVFSGVIPQGVRPEKSEIWMVAQVYGARPLVEPSPAMTHCVCVTAGTEKTHRTQKLGKWVVKLEWMLQCLAEWRRVDEAPWDCFPEQTKARLAYEAREAAAGRKGKDKGMDKEQEKEGEADGEPGGMRVHAGEEVKEPEGGAEMVEGEMDDPGFETGGWDEAAEREFEAFLEGSDDGMSEKGSVASSPSSVPGTPRKRVRYADEEDLPLTSFRDPPAKRPSMDVAESGDSPERKRKRPIQLGPPPDRDEGDSTKIEISEAMKERIQRQVEEAEAERREEGEEAASEAETEGEDEFARMLAESLDE